MFLRNSRYADLPTEAVPDPHGTPGTGTTVATVSTVTMVRLRPLPLTPGGPRTTRPTDTPDGLADALYGDATRYWHIADANTELEAAALTRRPGRVIQVPRS